MKSVYSSQKILIPSLKVEEVTFLKKDLDFANVFSFHSATKLLEHFKNNTYNINLNKSKQSLYKPI